MGKSSRIKNRQKPAASGNPKSWFPLIVTVAVVLVIGIFAFAVTSLNNRAVEPQALPASAQSSIVAGDGGIRLSDGKTRIEVYLDAMCPFCGQFENNYTEPILADEELSLTVRPISILDRLSQGTNYSTRAATAIYAVAAKSDDAEVTAAYIAALFADQPEEGSEGYSNEELFAFASDLGVDITEADLKPYETFVQRVVKDVPIGPDNQTVVTPTILVNGTFTPFTGNVEQDIASWK